MVQNVYGRSSSSNRLVVVRDRIILRVNQQHHPFTSEVMQIILGASLVIVSNYISDTSEGVNDDFEKSSKSTKHKACNVIW